MVRPFEGIRGKLVALALVFAGAIALMSLLMLRAFSDVEAVSRDIVTGEAARSRELAALSRAVGSLTAANAKLRRGCVVQDIDQQATEATAVIERQLERTLDPVLDQATRQLVVQSTRLIEACRDIASRSTEVETQEGRLLAQLDEFENAVGRAIITETLANRNVDGLRQALAASGGARGHLLVASRNLSSHLAPSRGTRASRDSIEREYRAAVLGLRAFSGLSGPVAERRVSMIRAVEEQQRRTLRLIDAAGQLESTFDSSLASDREVSEAVRALDEQGRRRVENLNAELRYRFGSAANRLLLLVTLSGVLISGLMLWIFRRGIQIPVERILRTVRSIQAGHPVPADGPIGDRDLETISDALRKMASDMNNALDSLRAASAEKTHFIAVMSHELRNPMNSIIALAQSLHEHESPPEERRVIARTIFEASRTLVSLLNDLLDVSRIESGRLALTSETFLVDELVGDVLRIFEPIAQQKSLRLDFGLGVGSRAAYQSDPDRLRQMLVNLVGNAVKFTACGQVHVEVDEVPGPEGATLLEFAVIDTGPGIEPDKLGLLFQPFSQVDTSVTRKYGGTGLGLWIVRNVSEALGGSSGCSSEPGRGSRFWFRVPVQPTSPSASIEPADILEPLSPGQTDERGRVLVVDDADANRLVCRLLLSRMNLRVVEAASGQEALEVLEQQPPPALVLMDLQMPGMGGLEATRRIREREARHGLPRVPIVALTANAQASADTECRAAGMDGVLSKPITRQSLAREVDRWLLRAAAAAVAPGDDRRA